jgi:hypothetical protein
VCGTITHVDNCLQYNDNDGTCKECISTHEVVGTDCVAYLGLNCLTYDTTTKKCLTCPDGYYLDTNNDCIKITIDGCKTCDTAGVCLTCIAAKILNTAKACVLPLTIL